MQIVVSVLFVLALTLFAACGGGQAARRGGADATDAGASPAYAH